MKKSRLSSASATPADVPAFRGTVYLVGAGPGDPGLLTRRAWSLLRRADVVVHDALVGEGILEIIRADAVRIDVGKRCGGRRTSQEEINELLVSSARVSRRVVRLKGGDPFIFGRGGEEAVALESAGVPFQVVPGVTAAAGVSAYAGIPLTHRELASSVTFLTGHGAEEGSGVNWDAAARLGGTLVIYMGLGTLGTAARRLIQGGRDANTPAAVVEHGTLERQRTVTGPLREIERIARTAGISAPALVIVGEVADLNSRLAWFDRLPLRGRRVLVIRTRAQRSRLTRAFQRLGAEVSEYPRLRYEPLDSSLAVSAAIHRIREYRWILFTSPAAVESFWKFLSRSGSDSRALAGALVAGLGRATVDALSQRGITPDVRTRTFDPSRVAEKLTTHGPIAGAKLLFPRENRTSSAVAVELRRLGVFVDEVETFRLSIERSGAAEGAEILAQDLIVLPSSSAASVLARVPGASTSRARVLAIGPGTAETALGSGLPLHGVADDPSVAGVVAAALEMLAAGHKEGVVPTPHLHEGLAGLGALRGK